MDSHQPKRSSSAFEYFLYAAILAETGLAALIYKVIFRSAELMRLRIYFAVFYVAFLVWTIAQLNLLHRRRSSNPEPQHPPRENTRTALGLTSPQLVILVVVFVIAVATFSWALRVL
jgi:Na+/H+ antiporter NhaC